MDSDSGSGGGGGAGGRRLQLMAVPRSSLILLGFRSIKPIAASYCSQTVSSVSSLDWSNDLMDVSVCPSVCLCIHFPAALTSTPLP